MEPGTREVTWLSQNGNAMRKQDWSLARPFGFHLLADPNSGKSTSAIVLMNATSMDIHFQIPDFAMNTEWRIIFDTARPDLNNGSTWPPSKAGYLLSARSFTLLYE